MRASRVYSNSTDANAVVDALGALAPGPDELVVVLCAEPAGPDVEALVERLRATEWSFFGALFPAILDGQERRESGVLAFTMPKLAEPILVEGLERDEFSVPDCLPYVRASRATKPTAIVLVDGLTANIARFLEAVYHQLGNRVSYWGGGAGSLALRPRPCVFTREGVRQDAAVIALSSAPARLGVRHGWKELKGPFVATRAQRNVIVELNWKNALEQYAAAVEPNAGLRVTPENFFRVAGRYPFAIRKEGQEAVVRDPVAVGEGGSLVCVGEVPENAVLSIHKGEPEALIQAAARAAEDARPTEPTTVSHCLVADCVSRSLFLGDRFSEELAAIAAGLRGVGPDPGALGMLTLGEISSHGEGYLEFFNKTCVVAVVHEP